jgi:hypothetical protein
VNKRSVDLCLFRIKYFIFLRRILTMNNVYVFTVVLLGTDRDDAQIILTLHELITHTSYLL